MGGFRVQECALDVAISEFCRTTLNIYDGKIRCSPQAAGPDGVRLRTVTGMMEHRSPVSRAARPGSGLGERRLSLRQPPVETQYQTEKAEAVIVILANGRIPSPDLTKILQGRNR